MLTKNELKHYSSLLKKKHRREEKKFIVEGKKILEEALNSGRKCELICITNEFNESHKDFTKSIARENIRLEKIRNSDFVKLSDTKSPQGICGIFHSNKENPGDPFISPLVVMLDEINDPGNVGTIIRTCDWFGINDVIISANSVDIYNPKVIRSTMGSLFHLTGIRAGDLQSEITEYKNHGYRVILADLDGENVFDYKPRGKTVIIFSNEAHGPSDYLNSLADGKLTIPRAGSAESLNVASAAAIIIARLSS